MFPKYFLDSCRLQYVLKASCSGNDDLYLLKSQAVDSAKVIFGLQLALDTLQVQYLLLDSPR